MNDSFPDNLWDAMEPDYPMTHISGVRYRDCLIFLNAGHLTVEGEACFENVTFLVAGGVRSHLPDIWLSNTISQIPLSVCHSI